VEVNGRRARNRLGESGWPSLNQCEGQYLIKLPQADKPDGAAKEAVSIEKVSSWELERLGTALSIGNNPLPLGMALKMSQVAVEAR
jgi:hypothetical protein